jgi:hypothetical protein
MSQQITLYLTPPDIRAAEERVRKCGEFLVLHWLAPTAQPRIVPSLGFEEEGKRWLFFYLVRPEDLTSIQMRKVKKQNSWAIDGLRSPVVEFSTCFFDSTKMRPGRVYLQSRYYGRTGEVVTKSDAFVTWARCVLATVKKTLVRDQRIGAYLGPDTQNWVGQGGVLLKSHE